jgi:hypothetical protein
VSRQLKEHSRKQTGRSGREKKATWLENVENEGGGVTDRNRVGLENADSEGGGVWREKEAGMETTENQGGWSYGEEKGGFGKLRKIKGGGVMERERDGVGQCGEWRRME